jgi:DNA invertase Pin-like site-specific DNA recombinase
MVFGMISVFSEFERAMIRDRVLAGLARTRAQGTRLGRPPMDLKKIEAIRAMLVAGTGIRETARRTSAGTASVMRIKQTMLEVDAA